MKRKFILLALLMFTIFGLVACGENDKPPKTVTVTFNLNVDGLVIEPKEIPYKGKLAEVVVPKVEGEIFLGWYLDGVEFDFNKEITEDITLTAMWKMAEILEITLNYNYGNLVETKMLYEGETLVIPEEPIREGYIFLGWYLNEELFDFTSKIYQSIILKAHWEETEIIDLKVKNANNLSFDLDEFKINDVKLEVTYTDGSVIEIEAQKEMLSDYDFETLFLTGSFYIYFQYGGKKARTQITLTSKKQQSILPEVIIYALKETINGQDVYTFYSEGEGDLVSLEIEFLTNKQVLVENHIDGIFGYSEKEGKVKVIYSFGQNINGNNKLFTITGVEGFSLKYVSENSYVYKYLNEEVIEEKEVRYYFR